MDWYIIPMMALAIPIVAIISDTILKLANGEVGDSKKYEKEISRLKEENNELKDRMGNLETIVANTDWQTLLLLAAEKTDPKEDTEVIANKLKKLKKSQQKKED